MGDLGRQIPLPQANKSTYGETNNLRQRLENTIAHQTETIKYAEQQIKRSKDALELLNKNKNLETLVNLLQQ